MIHHVKTQVKKNMGDVYETFEKTPGYLARAVNQPTQWISFPDIHGKSNNFSGKNGGEDPPKQPTKILQRSFCLSLLAEN